MATNQRAQKKLGKKIDGKKRYWCSECNRWTESHGTDGHKTKEQLQAERAARASAAKVDFDVHPYAFKAVDIPKCFTTAKLPSKPLYIPPHRRSISKTHEICPPPHQTTMSWSLALLIGLTYLPLIQNTMPFFIHTSDQ